MKEIIVITRIDPNINEFVDLFRDVDKSPIEKTSEDSSIHLRIVNGSALSGKTAEEQARAIAGYLPAEYDEAVIAIHAMSFMDILATLESNPDFSRWTIKKYSSQDDNYGAAISMTDEDYAEYIRPSLMRAEIDPAAVVPVYHLFGPDRTLEASLDLLHQCLAPTEIVSLPKTLLKTHSVVKSWNEFVRTVTKDLSGSSTVVDEIPGSQPIRGTLPCEDIDAAEADSAAMDLTEFDKRNALKLTPVSNPFGEEYINALTNLRDALLVE